MSFETKYCDENKFGFKMADSDAKLKAQCAKCGKILSFYVMFWSFILEGWKFCHFIPISMRV